MRNVMTIWLAVLFCCSLVFSGGCASSGTSRLRLGDGVTLELVRVPAGEFMMGSPASEANRHSNEGPRHLVRIDRPFYMGRYEVTQAQWVAVMGENPSWYPGEDLPVNRVSWRDAQAFCEQLSQRSERKVRLPSESEWEYACRAGSQGAYCYGNEVERLSEYAWYVAGDPGKPQAVGGKKPNAWGLYDMHGNVWEWCADRYHVTYEDAPNDGSAWRGGPEGESGRMLRGGSWFSEAGQLRCATRLRRPSVMRSGYIGFRVVVEERSGG